MPCAFSRRATRCPPTTGISLELDGSIAMARATLSMNNAVQTWCARTTRRRAIGRWSSRTPSCEDVLAGPLHRGARGGRLVQPLLAAEEQTADPHRRQLDGAGRQQRPAGRLDRAVAAEVA